MDYTDPSGLRAIETSLQLLHAKLDAVLLKKIKKPLLQRKSITRTEQELTLLVDALPVGVYNQPKLITALIIAAETLNLFKVGRISHGRLLAKTDKPIVGQKQQLTRIYTKHRPERDIWTVEALDSLDNRSHNIYK